jgi:hypothetical protein
MGMYTELIFGAEFVKDLPGEVLYTIQVLCGTIEEDENRPLLFPEEKSPLNGASYYFGVSKPSTILWQDDITKQWVLSSRSNIKNYHSQIEEFLKWIEPYIESGSGACDMYAIVIYEESDIPTIYYKNPVNG